MHLPFWRCVSGYFSEYHGNRIVGGVRSIDSEYSCVSMSQSDFDALMNPSDDFF